MYTESGIENEETQPTDFNGLNLTYDEPVTATEAAGLRHKAANGGKTTALIDFMPQTEITGIAGESMPDSAEGIIADPIKSEGKTVAKELLATSQEQEEQELSRQQEQ